MAELTQKRCKPCEGGIEPLSLTQAEELRGQLHAEWSLAEDGKSIARQWKFRNFYHTMSFVNAVAHIANAEDHHPDLEVGYGFCKVKFTTHAISGLSENDFICAAKVDQLSRQ
jgi:4a-hydroxytetrahydrobiopterin dehydratase